MDALKERFWSRVDKSGNCWTWTRYVAPNGYARFDISGTQYSYVHRLSYEWAFGEIPPGMEVDHTCHTRSCVNPGHLRAVTRKQNNENLAGPLSNSKSGIRGVWWVERRQRWCACVVHNGKKYHLGLFRDIEYAEAAVIAGRNELFTHNDLDRKAA